LESFADYHLDEAYQTTASEDMSEFLSRVPGCYFFVGSADPQHGLDYPHHHPKFDFDENVLPIAAALMTGAVLKLLTE
jgi:amidohydrolase